MPSDQATLLRTWVEQQDRLYQIAAPLLINNTDLCQRHARNLLGITAKTKYSYSEDFVDTAQTVLGLGDALRVMNVLPGSGASLSGIRKGDTLLAVEIEPLPQGPGAEKEAGGLIASEMKGRSSLGLTLQRDEERMTFDVPLTPACAMAIDLGNTDTVNSYADGARIMVTRGMLGFVRSDDELAYVLAQEVAYNILNSSPSPDMAQLIDSLHTLKPPTLTDIAVAPPQAYPSDLHAAADELALYLLVRAGYNIDSAPNFWQRLMTAAPIGTADSYAALHALTGERIARMQETVQVVQMKQKSDLPLMPQATVPATSAKMSGIPAKD